VILSARAIALQGIGFTPRLVALQGFGFYDLPPVPEYGGTRGKRHSHARLLPGTDYNLAQLHQEDEAVTDLLITLVTKGFFDGKFQS